MMGPIYSIYKATNTITGQVYIGFTSNFPKRQYHHIWKSRNPSSNPFHQAILEYGPESFEWEIICQSRHHDHLLNEMEPYFIKEYNSYYTLPQFL